MSRPTIGGSVEAFRFEPTVFGAMRRYRTMVLVVAVLLMVAAIGYTLMKPKLYRAQASVTAPQQMLLQGQQADPSQFLDSQVLLLQSEGVAQRAAAIANADLHSNQLATSDFFGNSSSLEISPPTATAGYGASVVGVSFTWPSARIAQAGANALLLAYDEAQSGSIRIQGNAIVAGIDQAINNTDRHLASVDQQLASQSRPNKVALRLQSQRLLAQRGALLTQRTQAVVNEQTDLAQQPTVALASEPVTPANHKWAIAGAIGLVIGIMMGAALAFAQASRRRSFSDRQDPAALYGVPLIGEIPDFRAKKTRRSNDTPGGGLLPMAANSNSAVTEAFRFAAGSVERVLARGRHPVPGEQGRNSGLSLIFVSPLPGSGKSTVVANLALAIAGDGSRVLVVDADAADGDLTALLLPGTGTADGFEQVLAGQRALADCVQPSPFNRAVAVLGSGPAAPSWVTGAARSKRAGALLAEAEASFDVVLIDSPALLQVADATELVVASDAAIIVLSPNELIRDHLEMVDRLNLIGSVVVGYIYNRAPMRPYFARYGRGGSSARPKEPSIARRTRTSVGVLPLGGEGRPSSHSASR